MFVNVKESTKQASEKMVYIQCLQGKTCTKPNINFLELLVCKVATDIFSLFVGEIFHGMVIMTLLEVNVFVSKLLIYFISYGGKRI